MYVIINDHFDYGWWGKFGACTEDANGNKIADETTRAEALKRYERYWSRFQNASKAIQIILFLNLRTKNSATISTIIT